MSNSKYFIGIVVLILFLIISMETSVGKMFVFSEVHGQILKDGRPISGAVVEREFHFTWGEETKKDQTQSDASGHFSFDKVVRSSSWGSILPHEPVIKQSMIIKYENVEYKAWYKFKSNYDDNGELGGKPINLVCRLEAQPKRHDGDYFGICEVQ